MEKEEIINFMKIDFNIKPIDELNKRISFPNSQIKKIIFRERSGFFYKFTFSTTFDYLENKEVISNEIYIFNLKSIEGDLSEYVLLESNLKKEEAPNFKNAYFVAKEELKKRIQEKTNNLSKVL